MNNYWEDLDMSNELKEYHESVVSKMRLPKWAIIDCPFCHKKLSNRSVRSISLCLNARNIGDIAVEFCCDECRKMDTIYYRKNICDMDEFICELERAKHTNYVPVIEEDMYKMQYNNLVEKMLAERVEQEKN